MRRCGEVTNRTYRVTGKSGYLGTTSQIYERAIYVHDIQKSQRNLISGRNGSNIGKQFIIQPIGWIKFFEPLHFSDVSVRANKKLLKDLGQRIREARTKQKISQAQLGFECGVHGEYIGRLERGLQSPTITILYAIAKTLDIKLADLVTFE